jgi:hypothetical protein
MKLSLSMSLIIFICSPAFAEEKFIENLSDRAGGVEFLFSDDSEGFQTSKISAEYLPKIKDSNHYLGARVSAYHYKTDDWNENGQKISIIARNIETKTGNGWNGELGVVNQGDHTLLTFDGNYRTPILEKTAIEFFANRDWIETKIGLEEGTHYNLVGVAIDQAVGDHITLVGVASAQLFSDHNNRSHGRLRFIYQPLLDLGLTLQARYRTYHSSKDDVGGAYFNPKNYHESMLAIGYRKRIANWSTNLTMGYGREKINDDSSQTTNLYEFNIESPIYKSQFLRLRAGYNRSASYYGPDYHYEYVTGEWILKF